MKLVALVTEPKSVARYLTKLSEPIDVPTRSTSRGPRWDEVALSTATSWIAYLLVVVKSAVVFQADSDPHQASQLRAASMRAAVERMGLQLSAAESIAAAVPCVRLPSKSHGAARLSGGWAPPAPTSLRMLLMQ
jgi:hypothetical protein